MGPILEHRFGCANYGRQSFRVRHQCQQIQTNLCATSCAKENGSTHTNCLQQKDSIHHCGRWQVSKQWQTFLLILRLFDRFNQWMTKLFDEEQNISVFHYILSKGELSQHWNYRQTFVWKRNHRRKVNMLIKICYRCKSSTSFYRWCVNYPKILPKLKKIAMNLIRMHKFSQIK